jgi:hypothetical protein
VVYSQLPNWTGKQRIYTGFELSKYIELNGNHSETRYILRIHTHDKPKKIINCNTNLVVLLDFLLFAF